MLLLFLLHLTLISSSRIDKPHKDIAKLDDTTFEPFIEKNENVLVLFTAKWCPKHCKEMKAVFKQLIESFQKSNPQLPMKFAKHDGTNSTITCLKYSVESFPTLKLFVNGNAFEYDHERTFENIQRWIQKKVMNEVVRIQDLKEVQESAKSRPQIILAIEGDGAEDNDMARILLKFARKHDEEDFYLLKSAGSLKELEGKTGIVAMLPDEENPIYSKENITADTLEEALKTQVRGLSTNKVFPISYEILRKITKAKVKNLKSVFLFRDASAADAAQLDSEFATLAKTTFTSPLLFVVADIKTDLEKKWARHLNIEAKDLPRMEVISRESQSLTRYVHSDKSVDQNAKVFIEEVLADKREKYAMSEDEKYLAYPNKIQELTGRTWRNLVVQAESDVLVHIYKPGCIYCEELNQTIAELLSKLDPAKNQPVFAQLDNTKNDLPDEPVEFYPTLRLYHGSSGSKKTFSVFSGDYTLKSVVSFVKINSKLELLEEKSSKENGNKTEGDEKVKEDKNDTDKKDL